MRTRAQALLSLLCLVSASVLGMRASLAEERSPAGNFKAVRELLRAQRFDGALTLLKRLKDPGDRAGEAASLEATAWLGKALQSDFAATEAMNAVHLSGTLKHTLNSFKEQPNNAVF